MRQASAVDSSDVCVRILLSTYNGAVFLPAQLESFLAQTHQNWVLYWRDDGSCDETVKIMADFSRRVGGDRCVVAPNSGQHIGVLGSFLSLLRESVGAAFVAFADQDDVWFDGKLAAALACLDHAGAGPALYCGRQYLVDAQLENRRMSILYKAVPPFPASLAYNLANGNTVVMNKAAASLVARSRVPEGTMHDWWSYIVVSACGGKVVYDPQPYLFYRLHKQNAIGRAQPFIGRAWAALQRGSYIYITMVNRHLAALLGSSLPLTEDAMRVAARLRAAMCRSSFQRLGALRCKHFHRQTMMENLLFRYWVLTGRVMEQEDATLATLDYAQDQEASNPTALQRVKHILNRA